MDSSSTYLFRGMGEGQMKKILAVGKEIPMKKGQQIIKEGQAANGVYILRSGAVELMTTVEKDFDLPISILRDRGDVFGTSALVTPYQYSLSARCVEDGVLFCIETGILNRSLVFLNPNHFLGMEGEGKREIPNTGIEVENPLLSVRLRELDDRLDQCLILFEIDLEKTP